MSAPYIALALGGFLAVIVAGGAIAALVYTAIREFDEGEWFT